VAERFLSAVEESSKSYADMSIFINYDSSDILKQAAESTSRHARGIFTILCFAELSFTGRCTCKAYILEYRMLLF
jgi:hypothetical protein